MVKILIEQNKTMTEMNKTQSDKREIPGPSNLAKRPVKNSNEVQKSKLPSSKWFLLQGCLNWPPLVVVGIMQALVPKVIM